MVLNKRPDHRLSRLPRLQAFAKRYALLQVVLICLALYGLFWAVTEGPAKENFENASFWLMLGYAGMVVFIPYLIVEAFSNPFATRYEGEKTRHRLRRARTCFALLILASGLLAQKVVFDPSFPQSAWLGIPETPENMKQLGLAVLILSVLSAGWVLRREQLQAFRRFWRSLSGAKPGRGWQDVKDLLDRKDASERSRQDLSPRLQQDRRERDGHPPH